MAKLKRRNFSSYITDLVATDAKGFKTEAKAKSTAPDGALISGGDDYSGVALNQIGLAAAAAPRRAKAKP